MLIVPIAAADRRLERLDYGCSERVRIDWRLQGSAPTPTAHAQHAVRPHRVRQPVHSARTRLSLRRLRDLVHPHDDIEASGCLCYARARSARRPSIGPSRIEARNT